jgi:hypothetical protein
LPASETLYGALEVKRKFHDMIFSFIPISLFDLKAHFFAPTRGVQTLSRAGAVKVGRRSDISSCAWRFQATP